MTASNQLSGGLEESRVRSLPLEVLPPPVGNGQPRQPRTVWQKSDLSVSLIEPNQVVFHSQSRFGSWRNSVSRKFLEQTFGIPEVREVEIDTVSRTATLSFQAGGNTKLVLGKIARVYRGEFRLHPNAGSISIAFNPSIIRADQIVRQLDLALVQAPVRRKKSSPNRELQVATGSLALSTAATFFVPLLLPIGAAVMLYTALPSFRRAWRVLKNERRLCVDVLDSMIFVACLFPSQIFVGAVAAWFLSFGSRIVQTFSFLESAHTLGLSRSTRKMSLALARGRPTSPQSRYLKAFRGQMNSSATI